MYSNISQTQWFQKLCFLFIINLCMRFFSLKRFMNKSGVHFISLDIKLRLRWCSARRAERGRRAPPARRRACSENARGVTIVSLRFVTKFDDRNHPPSKRAGSSRSDNRQGVGAVRCVPSARLCNSKTYLCINLKITLSLDCICVDDQLDRWHNDFTRWDSAVMMHVQ